MKPFKENTGEKLHGIEFGNNFLDMTPKTQVTTTTKKLNWTSSKFKTCVSEDTQKRK